MKDLCRYADRPLEFLAHYVMARPVAHAVIVTAVTCSVGAQYGVKILVDALSGGLAGVGNAAHAWSGFLLLASLIAADNLLWRLASWIASSAFVGVTGDLRRDLFRHLTGHAPSFFADRMSGREHGHGRAATKAIATTVAMHGGNTFQTNMFSSE